MLNTQEQFNWFGKSFKSHKASDPPEIITRIWTLKVYKVWSLHQYWDNAAQSKPGLIWTEFVNPKDINLGFREEPSPISWGRCLRFGFDKYHWINLLISIIALHWIKIFFCLCSVGLQEAPVKFEARRPYWIKTSAGNLFKIIFRVSAERVQALPINLRYIYKRVFH